MTESTSSVPAGVLIVGGGLVGASLAIALDQAGVAATLVEAVAPRVAAPPSHDDRNLALARASVNALAALGVWPYAVARATPIWHVHVSRAGEFGATRIDAAAHGIDALGWTLPGRELGAALTARLAECTRLTRLAPARLRGLAPLAAGWRAELETDAGTRRLDAALVVGADGTHSFVRQALGIGAAEHDYRQTLFVATLATERAHANRAWERFADGGPVALLPLAERRCGLVLTLPEAQAEAVAALDDAAFLALAQERFGWRLGRFSDLGKRHPYRIVRVTAERLVAPRAVLVGNAAQSVHPIGAQGFNLGLRDALTLAELVATADDPGTSGLLAAYARRRRSDREGTLAMSHGLVQLACRADPWWAPLRSLALVAADRIAPVQRRLARAGMGFRGIPPLLARERLP